ncbi:MAG: DAK2 domain-containing protein [Galactobacter sp.]|uniref:DAK2 domain-containing protein n=1 Tax=Galactobacter sp. TaxID=2676125 RepID=UPI0025B839ED|nr:DAK2 domain-containing protein [Galactobacter sp.]
MSTDSETTSRPSTGEAALRGWLDLAVSALGNHSDRLNAINVFPVADGDTGSNLYRTARSIQQALRDVPAVRGGTADLGHVLGAAARTGLESAQGNSGTLLAVALCGFAEGLEGVTNLTGPVVARAIDVARVRAWSALSEPVEGTLLSTLSLAARAAGGSASMCTPDEPARQVLSKVFTAMLTASAEGVSQTRHQLASVQEARVVDAGAVGMHLVLESLVCAVMGTPLDEDFYDALPGYAVDAPDISEAAEQAEGVEVMCTVSMEPLAAATLRAELDSVGDSVLMTPLPRTESTAGEDHAGSEFVWRVHVHVPDAEVALNAVRSQGEPTAISITSLSHDHGDASASTNGSDS